MTSTSETTNHPLTDQAAQSAERAIASTRRMANDALDGLSGSVGELQGLAGPALGRIANKASALAHGGVDAVVQGTHRLADQAHEASDSTVRYIRREPVKAMLLAAAAGAALMALARLLLDRRSHD